MSRERGLLAAIRNHQTGAFLAITFGWGWAFYVTAALVIADHPEREWWLVFFQTPGAAAALIAGHVVRHARGGRQSVERGWRRYLEWRKPWWMYAVAFLALPLLGGIAAAIVGRPGSGLAEMWQEVGLFTLLFLPISVIGQLATSPLLEEYGWRGFLQPLLQQRHPALPSAVIVGLLWGLHHVPIALAFDLSVWLTVFGAVGPSILAAWLLNEGVGSMVHVMILHASLNVSLQVIAPAGALFDVLVILFAVIVVVVTGTVNLARRPRFTLAAEESSSTGPASC